MPEALCHACHAPLSPAARFCGGCGAQVASTSCPKCGAGTRPGAKFCGGCGAALTDMAQKAHTGPQPAVSAAPVTTGDRKWVRQPGEFARRFDSAGLQDGFWGEFRRRGVSIEEGTRGLLFQGGKFVGVLEPGLHKLETTLQALKSLVADSPLEVVVVDIGNASLVLAFDDLLTSDDQTVSAKVSVAAALKEPLDFYLHQMRSAAHVTSGDLARRAAPGALAVLQALLRGYRVDELYGNRALLERAESELRQAVEKALAPLGLVFQHLEYVDFAGPAFDEARRKRGALKQEETMQALQQQRVALNEKFRDLFNQDRMNKIKSQADFDAFCKDVEHAAGVKELLRAQDREELFRQIVDHQQDYEIARKNALATLHWQQKREQLKEEMAYKRELVANRTELDDAQRQARLRALREEHQAALDTAYRDHEAQLTRKNRERDADLKFAQTKAEAELELAAKKRARQQDQDKKDADLAMELYRQQQQIKQQTAKSSVDLDLHKRREEQSIQDLAAQAAHQRELERLEQLGSLSTEALIASTPAEQAAMIAELKKTESLKSMTEEQILALAAEKSPEVAKAFAEKYKSAGSKEMYERMLEEQKASSQNLASVQQDHAKVLRDLMETVLKTHRDTAVAAAHGPLAPQAAVIYPPAGAGPATYVAPPQQFAQHAAPQHAAPTQQAHAGTSNCPRCASTLPGKAKFCENCGYSFS